MRRVGNRIWECERRGDQQGQPAPAPWRYPRPPGAKAVLSRDNGNRDV